MAVFAILSEEPQPELRAAIAEAFPEAHFHWSDTVSFVRSSGTSKSVAEKVDVKRRDSEDNATGRFAGVVVSQLTPSYFGWSKATLWEWLKSSFEEVG